MWCARVHACVVVLFSDQDQDRDQDRGRGRGRGRDQDREQETPRADLVVRGMPRVEGDEKDEKDEADEEDDEEDDGAEHGRPATSGMEVGRF